MNRLTDLDPIGIKEMRDLFKMLCKEYGITILMSSHILAEIEQIADTIGIINNGRLVEEISMAKVNGIHTEYIEIAVDSSKKAAVILETTRYWQLSK